MKESWFGGDIGRKYQESRLQAARNRVRLLDLRDGLQVKGKTWWVGGGQVSVSNPSLAVWWCLCLADRETRRAHSPARSRLKLSGHPGEGLGPVREHGSVLSWASSTCPLPMPRHRTRMTQSQKPAE